MNSIPSAGGVSALLQIADHPNGKAPLRSYDGNIAALLNADTGDLAAAYDGARQRGDGPTARLARRAPPCRHRPSGGRARQYTAFGEPLRAQCFDPSMANNPFRFSTKFMDSETGLVYYGRRYYTPREGRFINRDPIEESGGLNLYGFVGNNPVNGWDLLGMFVQRFDPLGLLRGEMDLQLFGSGKDILRWGGLIDERWRGAEGPPSGVRLVNGYVKRIPKPPPAPPKRTHSITLVVSLDSSITDIDKTHKLVEDQKEFLQDILDHQGRSNVVVKVEWPNVPPPNAPPVKYTFDLDNEKATAEVNTVIQTVADATGMPRPGEVDPDRWTTGSRKLVMVSEAWD